MTIRKQQLTNLIGQWLYKRSGQSKSLTYVTYAQMILGIMTGLTMIENLQFLTAQVTQFLLSSFLFNRVRGSCGEIIARAGLM